MSRGPRYVEEPVAAPSILFGAMAGAFSLFHIVRAILTLPASEYPALTVASATLYGVLTALSLIPSRALGTDRRMPLWVAILNLVGAALITVGVSAGLSPAAAMTHASWHVSAVGTLLVITLVRGHELIAWGGALALTVHSILWVGLGTSVTMGVPGSLIWVLGASVLTHALSRLTRDSSRLAEAERRSVLWRAERDAYRRERLERLGRTERRAAPMLREIILAGGNLEEQARTQARLLEAGMRDEIRGRALLDERVRQAALAARSRGVDVRLLDEGGIDALPATRQHDILGAVATALEEMVHGQLIVRTVPAADSAIAVTIVGLATDPETGELDMVLRRALPRIEEPSSAR